MGVKLQGILIDKNFENSQDDIFTMLNVKSHKLLRVGKFKDYWNGFQPKGRLVLSFYNNASIISCDNHFISSESAKRRLSKNNQVAAFYQYDTISAIAFDLYKNGEIKRRLYTDRASKPFKHEEGEKLEFEQGAKSAEAAFYKMTQHFLGHRLDSSYLHDPANSYEYDIEYEYPGIWKQILGNQDYHSYWRKAF